MIQEVKLKFLEHKPTERVIKPSMVHDAQSQNKTTQFALANTHVRNILLSFGEKKHANVLNPSPNASNSPLPTESNTFTHNGK